jgi:threonine dehydratase
VTCAALDQIVGGEVFIKAENFQRVGAFKFRGAFNRVSTLSRAQQTRGVVASSSGNHAQALALAARLCDSKATILMPEDAPNSKLVATRAYGAEVILFDRYQADRELLTAELANKLGATIVHAYDDPYIIAGAGTAGLEIMEEAKWLDVLLVPTGGGGLLAGSALAAKAAQPTVRIVGVEPESSDDWQRSLAAGERVSVQVGQTIADGQQLPTPGKLNFEIAAPLLESIKTVTDAQIRTAMRFLFERVKIVAEPSGATAVAALLAGKIDVRGQRVGVIISGGNIDVRRFAEVTSEASMS